MGLWSDYNSVYLSNRIWTVLKITFSIIAHCQAMRMPVELHLQFIAYMGLMGLKMLELRMSLWLQYLDVPIKLKSEGYELTWLFDCNIMG